MREACRPTDTVRSNHGMWSASIKLLATQRSIVESTVESVAPHHMVLRAIHAGTDSRSCWAVASPSRRVRKERVDQNRDEKSDGQSDARH
jgi:hypothetical protein